MQPDRMVEAHPLAGTPHEAVGPRRRAQETAIAREDEHGGVHERIVGQHGAGAHPERSSRRAADGGNGGLGIALAHLERPLRAPRARVAEDADAEILPVGQPVGGQHGGHRVLMRQPLLRTGEARRQQEDGRCRLPSHDAPGDEPPPVAHPLHVPFNHQALTSGAQEVCMQRVRERVPDRAPRRHQTLRHEHAAEDAPLSSTW